MVYLIVKSLNNILSMLQGKILQKTKGPVLCPTDNNKTFGLRIKNTNQPILKHCIPSGIPIIVIHNIKPPNNHNKQP